MFVPLVWMTVPALGRGVVGALGGRAPPRLPRNFDIRHLQIGKSVAQHRGLFVCQIAARFFLNHGQLIDEHLGQLQVHFAFTGFWIWNLTEEKRGILRVHHDELDEALRKLAALCAGLDFSHGSLLFRGCGTFWRSHRCQNIRLIAKIFRSHVFDVVERHRIHVVLELLVIIKAKPVELVQRAMVTESSRCFDLRSLVAQSVSFSPAPIPRW